MAIVIQIEQISPGQAAETIVTETFQKDEVTLGRAGTNDVVLKAPDVSGTHAKLLCKDANLYVVDLNSSNGTYLEDAPVAPGTEVLLPDNGRLIMGSFVVTAIYVEDANNAEEIPPPESVEELPQPEQEEAAADAEEQEVSSAEEEAAADEEEPEVSSAEDEVVVDDSLLDEYLATDYWCELIIRSAEDVMVDKGEGLTPLCSRFSSEEACEAAIRSLIVKAGIENDTAVAEGMLENQISFRAMLPPVASRSCAVLRRFAGSGRRIHNLVSSGFLDEQGAELLLEAIRSGHSVIICGEEGSGKTTLLGALAAEFFESHAALVLQEKSELHPDPRATFVTLPVSDDDNENSATIESVCGFVASLRPEVLFISNCSSILDARIFDYLSGSAAVVACFNSPTPEAFLADLPADWRKKLDERPRLILQLKKFPDGSRGLFRVTLRSPGENSELEELIRFHPDTARSRSAGRLEVVGELPSVSLGGEA